MSSELTGLENETTQKEYENDLAGCGGGRQDVGLCIDVGLCKHPGAEKITTHQSYRTL